MAQILIVEDEERLAALERDYFKQAHYDVVVQHRGDDAEQWLKHNQPDLIVLDLMLPGLDGISLCKKIRANSSVPIIMTTAKVEEIDRLLGLELGADDYLCKPFSLRELVARTKVILKRVQPNEIEPPPKTKLWLNTQTAQVSFAEKASELTIVELNLLSALMDRSGHILSRDQLIDRIYKDQRVVSDRTIDSHIKKLRKKLNELDPEHDYIHSVYGAGYRFDPK
ncbi:response regulator [Reinekea marina]|uniref:Response regulator n=1 Tax=Reinekea marina TaxID=1310421 RepID=A0ABV7WS44_9GAMM|nr:response regulator [Reinekea marina]MDN3648082.1 response regulator [Reinekea marina]